MMEISDIVSVKLVAAILCRDQNDYFKALDRLGETYSDVDFQGEFFPFKETDYYESEMGSGLMRGMISFKKLVHPGYLVESKLLAKKLENEFTQNGNRRINIDVGYLDLFKVVLASFKGRSNKIYMSDGIWADMILYFEKGDYQTFMWGFPDFKSGIYNRDLSEIRSIYKEQLKQKRKATK